MTTLHRHNTDENYTFSGLVIATTGIGALVCFVNASHWIRIRNESYKDPNLPTYRDLDPDSLFLINGIVGVILLGVALWAILRLLNARRYRGPDYYDSDDEDDFIDE